MNKTTDGGPAFPRTFPGRDEGMKLRDYFAAKAMTGLMTMAANECHDIKGDADLARQCYGIADAMLKTRGA